MTGDARKAIFLIIDGLGDRPIPALDGQTPLEAAHTPNFDRMASLGEYGLVDPLGRGEIPNTDSGVGLLLGLPVASAHRLRRGPIEAAGVGRPLSEGEIAVRANFATLEARDGELLVRDRRAGRIREGVAELAAVLDGLRLDGDVTASFINTEQHRGVVILSGSGLSPEISDTDPGDGPMPVPVAPCKALAAGAEKSAGCINEFIAEAHRRLAAHPLNRRREARGLPAASGVITRGGGAWFRTENVLTSRGLSAVTVAGCTTVRGLARILGWETRQRPSFTADLDTDLEGKVAQALEELPAHDLVYVHVKGPDICAHDRQPERKRDFLQRLDRAVAPLLECGAVVALSSDHTTDSNSGAHAADPVPAFIYDPALAGASGRSAPTVNFSERACRSGTLARRTGAEFLQRVLDGLAAG